MRSPSALQNLADDIAKPDKHTAKPLMRVTKLCAGAMYNGYGPCITHSHNHSASFHSFGRDEASAPLAMESVFCVICVKRFSVCDKQFRRHFDASRDVVVHHMVLHQDARVVCVVACPMQFFRQISV